MCVNVHENVTPTVIKVKDVSLRNSISVKRRDEVRTRK
jgi:hypothetical protein